MSEKPHVNGFWISGVFCSAFSSVFAGFKQLWPLVIWFGFLAISCFIMVKAVHEWGDRFKSIYKRKPNIREREQFFEGMLAGAMVIIDAIAFRQVSR